MGYIKKALTAVPLALVGVAIAANIPTISRYLRIRSESRDHRPMGVTTTPRSYVTGRPESSSRLPS